MSRKSEAFIYSPLDNWSVLPEYFNFKMADEGNNFACSFKDLGLNNWLVRQCHAVGIKKPTEIQLMCIPPVLRGQDCIGCAKTGSGKTAAFALPILQRLCEDPYGIFAVVLTPTRRVFLGKLLSSVIDIK